jgi:glycosyltransferase involved in cell wall biosynthesis
MLNGWDVTWICYEDPNFCHEIPRGVNYIPLPFKRGIDPFGMIRAIFKLYLLFKQSNFCIVQYSTPNAAFYTSTAARLADVPVRLYAQWGIRYVGFEGMTRRLFKFIEQWCCKCSTMIEPDSFSNLKFALQEELYTREKSRVIWNGSAIGVNLERFDITKKDVWRSEYRKKMGIEPHHLVIGFVGSLRQDKGCNELITACRSLFSDMPDSRLLLIGDKHFYDTINKDLREWIDSSHQVIYIPPNNDIPQYMACMDIFSLPSYREGFGLVIVEAESMGVPAVVSDVPGPIDAVLNDKTGLVVPVKNSSVLATALQCLLSDAGRRAKYGTAAAIFARNNFEQNEFIRRVIEDKEQIVAEMNDILNDSKYF